MAMHVLKTIPLWQSPRAWFTSITKDHHHVLSLGQKTTFSSFTRPSKYIANNGFSLQTCNKFPTKSKFACLESSSIFPVHTSVAVLQSSKDSPLSQILSNVKHIKSSPLPPLVLGVAGVLPFIGPPLYFLSGDLYDPQVAFAQLAYGAAVLSFLGGVRWGFTIPENSTLSPDWKNLSYSIAPCVAAWISLLFPVSLSTLTIASGIAAVTYYDNILPGYPLWFKALRTTLSLVVIVSLLMSLMFSLFLEHESPKK